MYSVGVQRNDNNVKTDGEPTDMDDDPSGVDSFTSTASRPLIIDPFVTHPVDPIESTGSAFTPSDVLMSDAILLTPAPPLFQPPPPSKNDSPEVASHFSSIGSKPLSPLVVGKAPSRRRSSSTQLPAEDKRPKPSEAAISVPSGGSMYFQALAPSTTSSEPMPVVHPQLSLSMSNDEKRKKNPAFLNTRPRFYELNNDTLMLEVWEALMKGQSNWIAAGDVQALIEFCKLMQLGARAPVRPPSGTIFYFDSRAGEYFRRDGYDYIKKKGSGISVREDHVKLRQGSLAKIYASYVHSAEWVDPVSGTSLFHRRSYWLVDSDEKDRGVIVHYLGNHDSEIEPVTRSHDVACECILCCLKRENSRPDRPGESLEQILSRAQSAAKFKKKKVPISVTEGAAIGAAAHRSAPKAKAKKRKSRASGSTTTDDEKSNSDDEEDESSSVKGGAHIHSGMEVERIRGVPRRAAAPSQPLVEASTSSDESDSDVRQQSARATARSGSNRPPALLVPQHSSAAVHPKLEAAGWSKDHDNWVFGLPDEVIPTSPGEHDSSFALPDHELEPLALLTPLASRRVSHNEIDFTTDLFSTLRSEPATRRDNHGRAVPPSLVGEQEIPWSFDALSPRPGLAPTATALPFMPPPPPPPQFKKASQSLLDADGKPPKSAKDPSTQKPATRFDFANLVVADVSPERLKENAKTLVVIGMGRMPETLNHRTWTEKIYPKLSIWFGEYRVPKVDNVALGVVRFVCPPQFRPANLGASTAALFECRIEGRPSPITMAMNPLPTWETSTMGGDLKRSRPSVVTPIKDPGAPDENSPLPPYSLSKRRMSSRSPVNSGGGNGFFVEEEEEEEDLDSRATNMVERVVRLMTSSGAGATNVAEIINEVSENGFNFLHTAVFCGASVDVVQMLLDHGADPNVRTANAEGNTALHLACDQGNAPVAKALVMAGASVNLANSQGFTAFDLIMSREEGETDSELFAILGVNPPPGAINGNPWANTPSGAAASTPGSVASGTQPMSPMRLAASPRPITPLRPSQNVPHLSALGESGPGGSHMALLREALSSLSLKEQMALAVAVNSDTSERKVRRSGSVSSATSSAQDFAPVAALSSSSSMMQVAGMDANSSVATREEDVHDDVAQVVTENHSSVMAAMGEMNGTERAQLDAEARKIQSNVRAWILRRQYREILEATKKMQALTKGHLARRHFRELREKVSATLVIQKSLRAHIKAKKAKEQQDVGAQQAQQPQEQPPPQSIAPQSLEERRFSTMTGHDAHAADEFILSSEDLFDVNMRDE